MERTQTSRNHMKLTTRLSGKCKYAFVDSPDHRADRILIGALIPAVFERMQPNDAEAGYELRICTFDAKYEAWFLNCMADLAWVLEGDEATPAEYSKACATLLGAAAA